MHNVWCVDIPTTISKGEVRWVQYIRVQLTIFEEALGTELVWIVIVSLVVRIMPAIILLQWRT